MASKVFLLPALSLVIASEVAARDLAETSVTSKDDLDVAEGANGLENAKHGYGGGKGKGYGGGKGGGKGKCRYYCKGRCSEATEVVSHH